MPDVVDQQQSWLAYDEHPTERGSALVEVDGDPYVLAEENGWGALLTWLAGPRRAFRSATPRDGYVVDVRCTDAAGTVATSSEARTADDHAAVRESVNGYLEDAGVPEQPDGYRWFVRVPAQCADAAGFRQAMARANRATGPAEVAVALRRIYDELDRR